MWPSRSGTTLIEQIISSHDDVEGCGELQALSKAVFDNTKNFDTAVLAMELQNVALQYLASERASKVKKRYFTDKMPINYRYLFLALSCLPSAKVIWCRRDRMPLKWSIYKAFSQLRETLSLITLTK